MRIILTADERAEIETAVALSENATASPDMRERGAIACRQLATALFGHDLIVSEAPADEDKLNAPTSLRWMLAHAETEADEPLTAEGELSNNLAEIRKEFGA
jgi:hypothetical protein